MFACKIIGFEPTPSRASHAPTGDCGLCGSEFIREYASINTAKIS
jgi:hypothetical protein